MTPEVNSTAASRDVQSAFQRDARRQSLLIAQLAADPTSDEAAVMRELEAHVEDPAFLEEWHA